MPLPRAASWANCGTFLLGSHHFNGLTTGAETGQVDSGIFALYTPIKKLLHNAVQPVARFCRFITKIIREAPCLSGVSGLPAVDQVGLPN